MGISRDDLLGAIMEASQDIILVMDPSGNVIDMNTYMEDLSGYKVEEVRGESWFNVFLPDTIRDEIKSTFLSTLKDLRSGGITNPILTRSGQVREILWYNKALLNEAGEACAVLAIGRDTTVRNLIEDRLRQSEKMEAIGHLAGGIAHDFNNMLAGIIGYADMSLEMVPEESMLKKNLRQILKAADRSKHLVRQILSFSRPSGDETRAVFIKPIIKEVLGLLSSVAGTNVEIRTALGQETKLCEADPAKIHEVLMNLCTNAVQSMNEGGILKVSMEEREVLVESGGRIGEILPGHYTVIKISDTGEGMDEETQRRLFEPFFTTKPSGKGTGMGLAVVFGILQSQRGNIQVTSALGEGTTFKVFLPKVMSGRRPESEQREEIPRGEERILFVDDEPILNELAKDLLTPLGYTIRTCMSAAAALEIIEEDPNGLDLLVTDLSMPGMSGLELSRAVTEKFGPMPVVLCSGTTAAVDDYQARNAGITQICPKPFSRRELGKAVRAAADSPT